MRFADIPFSPPKKTLRQFAALWLVFFLGLGAWQGWLHDRLTVGLAFAILAVTVGTLGLLVPQAIRPLFVIWMVLAFPIGWLISHVVLGLVFYGMFTPLGLAFKLWGRDALRCRRPKDRQSYWSRKPATTDSRRYFRQF